jgi:hypothetical protein
LGGEAGYWERTDRADRLVAREQAAMPEDVDLAAAQGRVNFVVYAPTSLPVGCEVERTTLRPEQPPGRPDGLEAGEIGQTPWSEANPCSLRTLVRGDGRALRIKQFLYDWAPPAAGVAPLWDSEELEPFECEGAVGWLGEDYRDARGGCVQLFDTQVEVSVIEGTFPDDELRELFRSLVPADPDGGAVVRAAPFHARNYWVRYGVEPYRVPYGLWAWRLRRPYSHATAVPSAADIDGVPSPPPGIRVESALRVDTPGQREAELILRPDGGSEHDRLWMIASGPNSEDDPPWPPELDERAPEVTSEIQSAGGSFWIAGLTAEYGPWDAIWREDGRTYAIWSAPTTTWTRERLTGLVEALRS